MHPDLCPPRRCSKEHWGGAGRLLGQQSNTEASTTQEVSDSSACESLGPSSAALPSLCLKGALQTRRDQPHLGTPCPCQPVPAGLRRHLGQRSGIADTCPRDQSPCFESRGSLTSFWRASTCGFHRRTSLVGAEGRGSVASTRRTARAGPCRPPAWRQPWERGTNLGRDTKGDG